MNQFYDSMTDTYAYKSALAEIAYLDHCKVASFADRLALVEAQVQRLMITAEVEDAVERHREAHERAKR